MALSRTKAAKRALARADDTKRVLDLARRGYSVRKIAEVLGCSAWKAGDLLAEGRKLIPVESAEALRHQICERQLEIIRRHWTARWEPDHAKIIQASDQLLIRMFGLEAPK